MMLYVLYVSVFFMYSKSAIHTSIMSKTMYSINAIHDLLFVFLFYNKGLSFLLGFSVIS
ncbi:hypothetical protein VCRA2119O147_480007 [Vibrio crassostreae]|nr:hypothetical protein VCRA2118O144_110106 [Vibrio crassostreae]CAK1954176.1 hypothetical protein VCRA2112O187_270011 [Vibrio crassostreae]CAK1991752.1 hypothetical protein VCRA2119O145_20340 [Vibrio crassostreae]CAK2043923.1 hypothetical protein VCRA2112O188_310039 [Vibrio crassostreae]CAK2055115.1 hypothetical protein VCRA2112O184_340011 [Vibrio crassostreae]